MTIEPIAFDRATQGLADLPGQSPAIRAQLDSERVGGPDPQAFEGHFRRPVEVAPTAVTAETDMPRVDNRNPGRATVGTVILDKIETLYGNLQQFQLFADMTPKGGAAKPSSAAMPGPAEAPPGMAGDAQPLDPATMQMRAEFNVHLESYRRLYLHTIEVDGLKAAVHAANSSLKTLLTTG